MAARRFRASGAQTAMARLVSRLRRRHLSAGRHAGFRARSFDAPGSAEARGRRARNFPISINWRGPNSRRHAACRPPSFPLAFRGGSADRRPDHRPGIRGPDAARLRPPGRARIRRLHAPAWLRVKACENEERRRRRARNREKYDGHQISRGRGAGDAERRQSARDARRHSISANRITSDVQSSGMTGLV